MSGNDNKNLNKRALAWGYVADTDRFTVNEIAEVIGEGPEKGREIVKEFEKRGFIKHVHGPGVAGRPKVYAKASDNAPVLGRGHCIDRTVTRNFRKTKQQKMWNCMKIHQKFTRLDLQMTADVSDGHAKDYLNSLSKAGYVKFLVKVKAGQKSKGKLSVYRLLRDTGYLAPIVRKDGVWDQNQQRFYPFITQSQDKGTGHEQR